MAQSLLIFPLAFMYEEVYDENVGCTGDAGFFSLGMPTFQYYYLMYDMDSATVTFVDLQGQAYVTSDTNATSDTVVGPEPVSTPESDPTISPSAAKQLTANATAMMATLGGALASCFVRGLGFVFLRKHHSDAARDKFNEYY